MTRNSDGSGTVALLGFGFVAFIALLPCFVGLLGGCGDNYSSGDRVGTITKISSKGLIWRSWEGELLMNDFMMRKPGQETSVNVFPFSTRDDIVAAKLQEHIGERVKITYRQWFLAPWQQSTGYTITDVKPVN